MDLVKHITYFLEHHVPNYATHSYLVAVSGGVDSMVLLHALQRLNLNLTVAHVNYHLRGEDSELDAALVKDYCKASLLKFHKNDAHINQSVGIQAEARIIRYSWFSELVKDEGIDYIFTAHHLDDHAETILQKLSRGTGLAGASGIKPVNGVKLRPLLSVPKVDLESYSEQHKVPFRTDVSNAKNTYTRNRIRNLVIPELEKVNAHAKTHIYAFSLIAKQAESLAIAEAKKTWDSNSLSTNKGHTLTLADWIKTDHAPLIMHYLLADLEIGSSYTSEILKLCSADSGKHIDVEIFTVWKNRDELFFEFKSDKKNAFELELNSEGSFELPAGKIELSVEPYSPALEFSSHVIYLPVENLKWPLKIRPWRAGDSFQPFGMKGRQKVSDLLIQKKIPASEKGEVLVLEHHDEIIWLIGVRSSELTRVTEQNPKVLKILLTV